MREGRVPENSERDLTLEQVEQRTSPDGSKEGSRSLGLAIPPRQKGPSLIDNRWPVRWHVNRLLCGYEA